MSVKKEASGRRSVQVEVEVKGTPEQVWRAIASGPGISAWFVPTKLEGRVGGALSLDDVPQGKGVMLVVDEPAPGVVLASAMDCMGMRMATLQAFYYGPRASAAAAQQEHWQRWLLSLFPPAAVAPPAP